MLVEVLEDICFQLQDNFNWIEGVEGNLFVVGLKFWILYVDVEGCICIVWVFNKVIVRGEFCVLVVFGRDYYDVFGMDLLYWEIVNIYDGFQFIVDMAVYNVIGDVFCGVIWIFLYNGGGVGWGEVMNGGFGMVIDGILEFDCCLESMFFWDVNNGIVCCFWACNWGVMFIIQCIMQVYLGFRVILFIIVDDNLVEEVLGLIVREGQV